MLVCMGGVDNNKRGKYIFHLWRSVLGKMKQVKEDRKGAGVEICCFIMRVSEGLIRKVKLEQTPNGIKEKAIKIYGGRAFTDALSFQDRMYYNSQ